MAVTGSMTITSLMMIMIFAQTNKKWKVPIAVAVCCLDFIYLCSTFTKLPHGAYWSIILASFPLVTILIWTNGQRNLYRALKPLDIDTFIVSFEQIYSSGRRIAGTALFFSREWNIVPPYVIHCIIRSNIVYERNVLISIVRTDNPFGVKTVLKQNISTGLDAFEIRAGYMVVLDIEKILHMSGIKEKVIFYGIEDINTRNPVWKIFSLIKKLTPNFVQFNKLPASRLHGVVTRVEM
jgi:KUP system potassium uptake protein